MIQDREAQSIGAKQENKGAARERRARSTGEKEYEKENKSRERRQFVLRVQSP